VGETIDASEEPAPNAGAEARAAAPSPTKRSRYLACVGFVFVIAGAGLWREAQAHGQRTALEACRANQKPLGMAVEMWELDGNPSISRLDAATRSALVSQGYLQNWPEDPGYGPGSEDHYQLAYGSNNGIACIRHGSYFADPADLADRPRALLRKGAQADAALLARASEHVDDNPPVRIAPGALAMLGVGALALALPIGWVLAWVLGKLGDRGKGPSPSEASSA
jgi:hypothetical protein